MKAQFFGTMFKILVVTLTLSGFVWFFVNRYVYKYPTVRKVVFWCFIIGFIVTIAMAVLSMAT